MFNSFFHMILDAYPDAAKEIVWGLTALHRLMSPSIASFELPACQSLIDIYPQALKIRDEDGLLPLHIACTNDEDSGLHNAELIKMLLEGFPQAAQERARSFAFSMDGHDQVSPLLYLLWFCFEPESYVIPRVLLDVCPGEAFKEDTCSELIIHEESETIQPNGDAFDYICCSFCQEIYFRPHTGARWPIARTITKDGYTSCFGGNAAANVRLIQEDQGHQTNDDMGPGAEACHETLLTILCIMYAKPAFLPLHAMCNGTLCRPWQLVVLREMLRRHAEKASIGDSDGNLPLHLLLKSCLFQMERAIRRGYASDEDDYKTAVSHAVRMVLRAYPRAASTLNKEGRLPLHLAAEQKTLPFGVAVGPLLEQERRALSTRDRKTRLYPFAIAAVGLNASLDVTYRLLRNSELAVVFQSVVEA